MVIMRIPGKKTGKNRGLLTEMSWLPGLVALLAAFYTCFCNCANPQRGAESGQKETVRAFDARIVGTWINFGPADLAATRQIVVFHSSPDSFRWSFSASPDPSAIPDSLIENHYWAGKWRVANDTLSLGYAYHTMKLDYVTKRQKDTVLFTESIVRHYHFNDSGRLAIAQDSATWLYFQRSDSSGAPEDTTLFSAVAPPDRIAAAFDTVKLSAGYYHASAPVRCYVWSFDGGSTYPDTSLTVLFSICLTPANIGAIIGAVRAVDANGVASVPDFFELSVRSNRPSIVFNDTLLMCSDQGYLIRASADTVGGAIQRYYWATDGSPVYAYTDSGFFRFSRGCLSMFPVSVFARNIHGASSDTIRKVVRIFPSKTYGTLKSETGASVVCSGAGAMIVGTADTGGLYQSFVYLTMIDSSGRQCRYAYRYPGDYKNVYAMYYATSIIRRLGGGFAVCGSWDDSYGPVNSGFLMLLDDSLGITGSNFYRENGIKGAGFSDIAATSSGGFVMGGFVIYDTCETLSNDQYGCMYYNNPHIVCVDRQGTLLWQHTWNYKIGLYGKVAITAADEIVYVSDSLLIKTDASGKEAFVATIPFRAADVIVTSEGEIVVLASDFSGLQTTLLWVSESGTTTKKQEIPSIVGPKEMIPLADHSLFVVSDRTVTMLSSGGALLWARSYDACHLSAAAQMSDKSIVVTGSTQEYGAGKSDAILIRLNRSGARIW
jgi:hypothetical protein